MENEVFFYTRNAEPLMFWRDKCSSTWFILREIRNHSYFYARISKAFILWCGNFQIIDCCKAENAKSLVWLCGKFKIITDRPASRRYYFWQFWWILRLGRKVAGLMLDRASLILTSRLTCRISSTLAGQVPFVWLDLPRLTTHHPPVENS